MMGIGCVCHNLNPRLFEADLEYIINHAEVQLFKHVSAHMSQQLSSWVCRTQCS